MGRGLALLLLPLLSLLVLLLAASFSTLLAPREKLQGGVGGVVVVDLSFSITTDCNYTSFDAADRPTSALAKKEILPKRSRRWTRIKEGLWKRPAEKLLLQFLFSHYYTSSPYHHHRRRRRKRALPLDSWS